MSDNEEYGDMEGWVEPLLQIPIFNTNKEQQKPIIAFVDKIIVAKKENPAADTTKYEKKIADKVHSLYQFTPEEIEIVGKG